MDDILEFGLVIPRLNCTPFDLKCGAGCSFFILLLDQGNTEGTRKQLEMSALLCRHKSSDVQSANVLTAACRQGHESPVQQNERL